jgi:DNA-binding transcriptional LysR family regulator
MASTISPPAAAWRPKAALIDSAYASGSLTGLLAVVRSGQALAVIARSAIPPDLQILGTEFGLPDLPALGIIIAFDRPRPAALATAFAEHVRALLPGI